MKKLFFHQLRVLRVSVAAILYPDILRAVIMKRSSNIAPGHLSTSYFNGSQCERNSMMMMLRSLGTSLLELAQSRFDGCSACK